MLSCLNKGLRPLGMIDRIGIELGFQRYAATMGVLYAAFTRFSAQEIAGVELQTGAICTDGHTPSGFRVGQNGAGIGIDLKIVVITPL